MKKLILPLLLVLFMGCSGPKMVLVNMPEDQFKKEHASAKVVELSEHRTVYRQYNTGAGGVFKYYYFKDGKLTSMDEGFYPIGASSAVPTPKH
jgi:hypothetical protein